MSKTVFEHVPAVFTNASGKTYKVQLDLKVKELYANQSATPIGRALDRVTLSPGSRHAMPDGIYTRNFSFDGTEKKDMVRVVDGTMLAVPHTRMTGK